MSLKHLRIQYWLWDEMVREVTNQGADPSDMTSEDIVRFLLWRLQGKV